MTAQIHLQAIKDSKGKSTGDYECSLCQERFRPNSADQGEMNRTFSSHVAAKHTVPKKTREDVNQAAARIVREATEG